MKKILGINWYYCLIPKENVKGLFTDFSRSSLMGNFLVCWDYREEKEDKKNIKLYALFKSYIDFAIFYFKLLPHLRCFYEIILGEFPQKPHFDIDMELNEQQLLEEIDKKVLNDLINVIISLIPTINKENDICIYSSHGKKETISKRSYHLIINHYCHANNKEAKAFYYTIMSKLPKEYLENRWIDHSVYSKTQQFRIYGSMKCGTNRTKILNKNWELNGEKIIHKSEEKGDDEKMEFLICLEESIIGARTSICKLLPSFETPNQFIKTKYVQGENLDYDMALEAINMLAYSVGTTPESNKFPYRFDKIEGPFVILKRVKASKCRLCNRIHHHQNPYLLIVPETKNVFFHCRRAPVNRKLYIGCLKSEEEIEESMNEVKGMNGKKDINEVKEIKSPEVVVGSVQNIEKTKEIDMIRANWTQSTLARLKEIASSSSPIKKTIKESKPECVKQIMKTIIDTKISE
jgi:hypothetical protein